MTFTAVPQLQVAILDRLRSSAEFMQLVSAVYDEVPTSPTYPHVIADDPFETPDRTFGQNGHDCTVLLSIYTQSPATTKSGTGKAGWLRGFTIAERMLELLTDLENNPLEVEAHDVVDVDVQSVEGFRENDGKTRRVDVIITALLEDVP